jgi:probable HAF family extracellular repeat protein
LLKEKFMPRTLKNFALALGLSGLALIPSTSWAQADAASKLPGKHPASAATQAASSQTRTPEAPSYTYTLFSYPGSLDTFAEGINLGATGSKIEIVGGAGQGGFLVSGSEKKIVTETYEAVNYPHGSGQAATAVNDSGQIVGEYDGYNQGYERSSGTFATIDVPFPGALGTFPYGINNSGEVVGGWWDSNKDEHAFTLIDGNYASFDYPGASETAAFGINSAGDIVGGYGDSSGVAHGFLLSGGTYTSFDFPGAVETSPYAINDFGDIVGLYCSTSTCVSTSEGAQGFLLSQGVFTTIVIPGEPSSYATGINNNGVVVGTYTDAAGLSLSFLAIP